MPTYREQFESALKCETKEEAEHWMKTEVERYMRLFPGIHTRRETINMIKQNLGYMAGYYDDETAKKIHRLFGAVHPIFGTADYHGKVTPEEALMRGKILAKD